MKILTVIERELLTRVRTKGFLVFTLLIPAIFAAFIFFEITVMRVASRVHSSIGVVDLSQKVYPALAADLASKQGDGDNLQIREISATAATLSMVEAGLRAAVLNKKLDAYLVIPADVMTTRNAQLHTKNAAAVAVTALLESELSTAVNRAGMVEAGIPASQISSMVGDFAVHQLHVSTTGDTGDNGQAFIFARILLVVLCMCMLLYGVTIMRAVIEEKNTRISEVLLSAVDPFSLMMGKILGVVCTSLCQFAVWGVFGALFALYGIAMVEASGANLAQYIPHASGWVYVAFVAFFVIGFLLYASVYAAVGAMVSSDQEAQQTQMPLVMMLVAAVYLSSLVMAQPASMLSVVLSLFPFFAPILMVMRIAVSNPPLWQVALSVILCLGTFLLLTKFTAKIYRVGILMTGKRPSLPELLRWLKYA